MIQTGLIPSAHNDLVTDASYDFYGLRLATCSLDQRIKIWQLDEANGSWAVEDDWKAHDAAVAKVSWAHPEFGTIIASASFDRTVKVWEQAGLPVSQQAAVNGNPSGNANASTSRWIERAILPEARGTVRAVEFAPHHFGLKLASISSDNHLRIYECLEQPALTTWQLAEEVDVQAFAAPTAAAALQIGTPTQTSAAAPADAPLLAQALQQSIAPPRPGAGTREADGGWCLAWCRDRYWGELLAAGAGTAGLVKIIHLAPSRRPTTLLTLDPGAAATGEDGAGAVTSVAWAPSCGRSYHLVATAARDGHVRIWRLTPAAEDEEDGEWAASVVADFEQHRSAVGRVEWNITGTVLASAGNDGRIRLWKATAGNVWRPAGSVGVEQAGGETDGDGDVEM